jgi:molybdopterin synthase catalytic subunit
MGVVGAWLTDTAIDVARLLSEVADPGAGGTVLFLGTVRRSAEDGDVESIEYSAYREMAGAEFARIVAEAAAQWPQARIVLQHRLGVVPTGEPSLVIAAAAPHRADAYAASRFVIEETKKRAPIWKKERLASGTARWVEGRPAGGQT